MTAQNTVKRHPEIAAVLPKWIRSRVLLEEREMEYTDAAYFLRLPNENDTDYDARKSSYVLGFVNQAGALLRSKGDAIYRKDVLRQGLTSMQEAFLKRADQSGQGFQEIMKNEAAPSLAAYGTLFAVIDKPTSRARNRAEEERTGIPYITILSPFQVIDFEWDKDGSLKWFKYAVTRWEDREPDKVKLSSIAEYQDIVTWTKSEYITQKDGGQAVSKRNPFGFVPVVIQAQFVDPNKTIGKTSFFTSSRYIFAGNNLLHAGNSEVFANAAPILLMQIQDWTDEETIKPKDPDTGLRKIEQKGNDQKRVLVYQKDKPAYIERSVETVKLAAERAEAYFDLAAENEKAALSINTATLPQSGVAKAYDFEDVNNVIASFAECLGFFEYQAFKLVGRMTGGNAEDLDITYPSEFDVRDFNAKINYVKGLQSVGFPDIGIQTAMRTLTPEITKNQDEQTEIDEAIKQYTTPEPAEKGVKNGIQ